MSAEKAEALVWPMVDMLAPLSPDHRIALLMALISQEICMFPAHERGPVLAGVINDLPGAFRTTEDEMRKILTDNAMRGM